MSTNRSTQALSERFANGMNAQANTDMFVLRSVGLASLPAASSSAGQVLEVTGFSLTSALDPIMSTGEPPPALYVKFGTNDEWLYLVPGATFEVPRGFSELRLKQAIAVTGTVNLIIGRDPGVRYLQPAPTVYQPREVKGAWQSEYFYGTLSPGEDVISITGLKDATRYEFRARAAGTIYSASGNESLDIRITNNADTVECWRELVDPEAPRGHETHFEFVMPFAGKVAIWTPDPVASGTFCVNLQVRELETQ